MRICYLANAASIHTKRWARHFHTYGHEVKVVSFEADMIDGVEVISLPSRSSGRRLNILLNLGTVRRLIGEIAPDVVHAHYATSYGLAAALAGYHPLVITAWGSDVLVTPEESWIYRQVVRFALDRADLVTSMAEHMTSHLVRRRYAEADKIITLPFGVDTDVFNLAQRSRRHRRHAPLVVSTRRLEHSLHVHLLVEAAPLVVGEFPDARVVLIGDGKARSDLEKLAADMGVLGTVEFRGAVPHEELPELLAGADVFVSTSPSDGNNISLNEAMACGAFPVATDIPANRTWIENGQNGLLFSCGEAGKLAGCLIEALRKPAWRQDVMLENWNIVRTRASWQDQMSRMESFYVCLAGD